MTCNLRAPVQTCRGTEGPTASHRLHPRAGPSVVTLILLCQEGLNLGAQVPFPVPHPLLVSCGQGPHHPRSPLSSTHVCLGQVLQGWAHCRRTHLQTQEPSLQWLHGVGDPHYGSLYISDVLLNHVQDSERKWSPHSVSNYSAERASAAAPTAPQWENKPIFMSPSSRRRARVSGGRPA